MFSKIGKIFLAAALSFAWAGPAAAAPVQVVIPPENTVSGSRILLGDIAFIDREADDEELAGELARIDLGPAPEAGREVVLRQGQLELKLLNSQARVGEAQWSLPEELRLTRESQEMAEDQIKKIITDYLATAEPYQSGRSELISLNHGPLPSLPPGQVGYRFVPQSSSNLTYLSGAIYFTVDGREEARVKVSGQVELSIYALVAARPLNRGHILDDTDLSLTYAPWAQTKGAVMDPDLAIGATLKTNLTAGEVIKDRHLSKSLMVKRGEQVTLVAQSGPLKVTASGQAKQDGAQGDTITVINLDSQKTVSGRVIGPSQVEILF